MRSTGVLSDSLVAMALTHNDAVACGTEPDIERLRERIGNLVRERQELRTAGASRGSLERNRLQLVRGQSELGRALIEQHAATAAI